MSQARLPRTEPSTELITAHKVNTATLMPPVQTRDFSALPKHRGGFSEHSPRRCLCVFSIYKNHHIPPYRPPRRHHEPGSQLAHIRPFSSREAPALRRNGR